MKGLMWPIFSWMGRLANGGGGSNFDLSKKVRGLDGRPLNVNSWNSGDHH